jgi:uncharacterized protein (UPF0261 family)
MKRIVCIGTLDTKGAEVLYLRNLIQKRGHAVTVIDDGVVGEPAFIPDITREEVAAAAGATLDEVISFGTQDKASRIMPIGLTEIVKRLYSSGLLNAVIGIGGSIGTSMATAAMRELPVGVPKLMVSTRAGLNESEKYVGTKDVTLMPSVCDIQGLNRITTRILANAAGAIAGMAEAAEDKPEFSERPLVVMSEVGSTTQCGLRVKSALESKGYEVVIFAGLGLGGKCQEDFIKNNAVAGVIELSVYEISNELFGGRHSSGPHRLEAAGERGIPQLITPGMVNIISFHAESVPDSFKDRQEPRYPGIVAAYLNADQLKIVAKAIAEKLNRATGPLKVLIPNRGFSSFSSKGFKLYDPRDEKAFTDTLTAHLGRSIVIREIDSHINDVEFADAVVNEFLELLASGSRGNSS